MNADEVRAACIRRLQELPAGTDDAAAVAAAMKDIRVTLRGCRFASELADNVEKLVARGDGDRAVRFLETAEIAKSSSTVLYVVALLIGGALLTALGIYFH